MKREAGLKVINDLLNSAWYRAPSRWGIDVTTFRFLSYKRSGLIELRNYVQNHEEFDDILDAIEEYRWMVDVIACGAKTDNKNFMFSTFYDVATEVLDMLLVDGR